ncbi:hypothetical protein BLOT_011975 [Blomia tropicalis]|nr:hypothetical protein BLOT_011975 [Blomia tropicalis]
MEDDIFDHNGTDDCDLILSERELNQRLNSIETAAFHDGFEQSRGSCLQKSFETGLELISPYFHTISMLEGIYDSLLFYSSQISDQRNNCKPDDLKPEFRSIYLSLYESFNKKINDHVETKICLEHRYLPTFTIVPDSSLVDRFINVRSKVKELCKKMKLEDLFLLVDKIKF